MPQSTAKNCPICNQSRTNCWYFQRLLYEQVCHAFWIWVLNWQYQLALYTLPTPVIDKKILWRMAAAGHFISRKSPPAPDDYHTDHLPAHWNNLESGTSRTSNHGCVSKSPSRQHPIIPLARHTTASSIILRQSRYNINQRLDPPVPAPIPQLQPQPPAPENEDDLATYWKLILEAAEQASPTPQPCLDDLPTCSITLEKPQDPAAVKPCGHVFSEAAIRDWMRRPAANSNKCPNCRGTISSIRRQPQLSPLYRRNIHRLRRLQWLYQALKTPINGKPLPAATQRRMIGWLSRLSIFASPPRPNNRKKNSYCRR